MQKGKKDASKSPEKQQKKPDAASPASPAGGKTASGSAAGASVASPGKRNDSKDNAAAAAGSPKLLGKQSALTTKDLWGGGLKSVKSSRVRFIVEEGGSSEGLKKQSMMTKKSFAAVQKMESIADMKEAESTQKMRKLLSSFSSLKDVKKAEMPKRDPAQDKIMAETDIVIPLKLRGVIFRSVIGAVHAFYRPRRIIVISLKSELEWLKAQLPNWQKLGEVGKVELVDEEMLFFEKYKFTKASLEQFFESYVSKYRQLPAEKKSGINEREFGWWYQQLIKIGAGELLGLSETYFVWDADLIPLKRWKLCDYEADGKTPQYYIAILQSDSKSPALANEYDLCMQKLVDVKAKQPENGGTFVCHHMAFNIALTQEMTSLMEERTNSPSWPIAILSMAGEFVRFSEYLTYSSFALNSGKIKFNYHTLDQYGSGGVRMRGGLSILDALLDEPEIKGNHDIWGGFSYDAFVQFATGFFDDSETLPPYVQLDHVYHFADPSAPLYKKKEKKTAKSNKKDVDLGVV